jgi:hypothetical protein
MSAPLSAQNTGNRNTGEKNFWLKIYWVLALAQVVSGILSYYKVYREYYTKIK